MSGQIFFKGKTMIKSMIDAGFSEREAVIYQAFLKLGEATYDECAKEAGLPRATAHRVIKEILHKGLIGEIPGKPVKFYPLKPSAAFAEILKARMDEIEKEKRAIPDAVDKIIKEAEGLYTQDLTNGNSGRDLVILRGKETIRNEVKMRVYESRKTLYREPLFFPAPLEVQWQWVKQYADENIVIYLLIESKMLKEPEGRAKIKMYLDVGHPVRQLPTFPGKMDIFDEKFALIAMRYNDDPEKQLAVLVNNRDLVGLLNRSFDSLWAEAKPVSFDDLKDE